MNNKNNKPPLSRSQQKRLATQMGIPLPEFVSLEELQEQEYERLELEDPSEPQFDDWPNHRELDFNADISREGAGDPTDVHAAGRGGGNSQMDDGRVDRGETEAEDTGALNRFGSSGDRG